MKHDRNTVPLILQGTGGYIKFWDFIAFPRTVYRASPFSHKKKYHVFGIIYCSLFRDLLEYVVYYYVIM